MSIHSPWYPASMTPERAGWYEVSYHRVRPGLGYIIDGRRYWTGKRWQFGRLGMECAMGCNPDDAWRGLKEPHA